MSTPGWYNDPIDPTLARWHDGQAWTEHAVDKAEWEAIGHEPPPPEELWPRVDPVRAARARTAVGAAAVVGALLVAGVALADGGGDDEPDGTPPPAATEVADRLDTGAGGRTDLTEDPGTSLVVPDDDGSATGSGGSSSGTRAPRTTATTRSAVQRTETRIETHENTEPVESQIDSDDETSVGNSTSKSIRDGYVPPPSTTAPPTTDTTAPSSTDTTAPPVSEPPVG